MKSTIYFNWCSRKGIEFDNSCQGLRKFRFTLSELSNESKMFLRIWLIKTNILFVVLSQTESAYSIYMHSSIVSTATYFPCSTESRHVIRHCFCPCRDTACQSQLTTYCCWIFFEEITRILSYGYFVCFICVGGQTIRRIRSLRKFYGCNERTRCVINW